MKTLFVLLALSIGTILVAVGAMLWRLRWHLRRPHAAPQNALVEIQPEPEPERIDVTTN